MTSYNKEIQITGGETAGAGSQGRFWVNVDLETRSVEVGFPAKEGGPSHVGLFASDDWDAIVAVINEAERQRGQIVSTAWIGQ